MGKYWLNKAEKVAVTINQVAKTKTVGQKEIVTYSNYIRLAPGKVYETDDKAMLDFFRAYKRKVKYTEEIERALKENNVPYEIEMCRSCGGRIRKIKYQVVEVEE